MTDISIIIPNYNTKEETAECVRSCLGEGSNCKIEIIIVDNASDDGSAIFFEKSFKKEKNVIVIKNSVNAGFSKAVNIGLKQSKGEYKYLLNSDTKIRKGTFSKLINYSRKNTDMGVIGTKLVLPDGSIQKSCFNFPDILNAVTEYWLGKKGNFSSFYKNDVSVVDAVVGASFFITPEAYKKVGLFDERYFMYFEDLDYCKRVYKAGMKVIYLPGITVFHHHGLSGKNETEKNMQTRRLIASSKIYHGVIGYYIINFILWSGQKMGKLVKRIKK